MMLNKLWQFFVLVLSLIVVVEAMSPPIPYSVLEKKMMRLSSRLCYVSFTLIFLAVLEGCADKPRQQKPLEDVVLVPKAEVVNIPKRTLEPCTPLPKMESRPYTQKEALEFVNELLTPYTDCRHRQANAVETLKKAFNSK